MMYCQMLFQSPVYNWFSDRKGDQCGSCCLQALARLSSTTAVQNLCESEWRTDSVHMVEDQPNYSPKIVDKVDRSFGPLGRYGS